MGFQETYRGKSMKKWYRRKTVWAAIVLGASVLLPAFTSLNPEQLKAIQGVLVAAMAIFMREAIEKK